MYNIVSRMCGKECTQRGLDCYKNWSTCIMFTIAFVVMTFNHSYIM